MFVIGQGLNILNSRIFKAVTDRDEEVIRKTAERQLENGADGLEINLGSWSRSSSSLSWMVEQVRSVSACPLFLPPCPEALSPALKKAGPGSFINCVTADSSRLESMFSAAECFDASVAVLLTRKGFLPAGLDEICMVAEEVLELAETRGFSTDRLVLDPVLRPRMACFSDNVAAVSPDISLFMEAVYLIGNLREKKIKTIAGLSNITTGLPVRVCTSLQVQALNMLRLAGLDYVIMSAGNRALMAAARQETVRDEMKGLLLDSSLSAQISAGMANDEGMNRTS